ncbi:hypothetical protein ACHAW6_007334 [Cyclotella cf. meneghiniana]
MVSKLRASSPFVQRHVVPCISRMTYLAGQRQILAGASSSDLRPPSPFPSPWYTGCCRRSYGSKTKIELDPPTPTFPTTAPPPIAQYLRNSLTGIFDPATNPNNVEFCLSFLGTSSGSATMHRNASCTALRLGGMTYLFDCAEGTNRQLLFSRIGISSISRIFVSHLHGDHVYGIVPLVLSIQVAAKLAKQAMERNPRRGRKRRSPTMMEERPTLEIFGPPGLYNYIAMTLALSCAKLNYLNVVVTELVGGREERGQTTNTAGGLGNGRRGRRNVFLSHYPEVETGLLKKGYLEKNNEDVWIISSPQPIDEKLIENEMLIQENGFRELPNEVNKSFDRRLFIKAAELDHLSGVQTFGYSVEELTPPGIIDAEKAKSLGIQPSKKYSLLKCGIPVTNDDGSAIIEPSQVLTQTFRARKFAFLPDHRRIPPPMAELCANADVLIHEATLSIKDGIDKVKIRGHSTAYNAGLAGKNFGCKVVVLNHFAATSSNEENVDEIVQEALDGNGGVSQVVASYDFMELWVPRGGFEFDVCQQTEADRQGLNNNDDNAVLSCLFPDDKIDSQV